jgi:exodeoxyribonuclease V alpha subunit
MTSLNLEQTMGAESICEAQATLVCGAAGSGKTTLLKAAIEMLEKAGKRYILLAPTGKAALRMRASTRRPANTIHKVLFAHNCDTVFANVDVIIVDEASMVDAELMGALSKKALMYGCRIALVGDPNQLPPVGPGKPFEDVLLATPEGVSKIALRTIYRQQGDSWVLDNAHKILDGEMVSLTNTHDFRFIETEEEITGETLEYLGRMWESGDHPSTFQVISPQRVDNRSYDTGATTERINDAVQKGTTPDGPGVFEFEWGRKFRTGDRVIQTTNNYRIGIVNGQQGVIVAADLDGVRVRFDEAVEEDAIVLYSIVSSECPHPRELDLAYAITVHRSQGSQWNNVLFIADRRHTRMLQRRLFYTAITRTEKHLTIVGSREAVERAIKTNMPNERRTLLQEKLLGKIGWVGEARI